MLRPWEYACSGSLTALTAKHDEMYPTQHRFGDV